MTRAVRDGLMLAAVAVDLAGLVYLNALRNPFVYDDLVTIVYNRALSDGAGIVAALQPSAFRPVTALSYALDRAVWGPGAFGYHVTSLLLHMLNVALLFGVVLAVLADRDARQPARRAGASRLAAAFAVASIFAVHPIGTEAVGYASARSEVLCATFILSAWLSFRAALTSGGAVWGVVGVALYALALGAREVAAMLPFLLLLWDRLFLGGEAAARRRRLLFVHLPLIAVTMTAALLRVAVFFGHEQGDTGALVRHLATQARVAWRYVALVLLPRGQSLVHDVPSLPAADPRTIAAIVALAALVAVLILARRAAPVAVFGVAWFLLLLLPASVAPLLEAMAEHRVYLASAGLLLAAVAGVDAALGILAPRRAWQARAEIAALAIVLVGLGGLTVVRNRAWADPLALWSDAAAKAPGAWRARFGLGNELAARGDCRAAIPEFEAALRLTAEAAIASNLATCLLAERRIDDARRAYERALAIDGSYAPAHYNLALLALGSGDRERAHRHFLMTVAPDWRRPQWREDLMAVHERAFAEPAKTLELCREILRVASETAGVRECIARSEARLRR